jgi:hypothetical protein
MQQDVGRITVVNILLIFDRFKKSRLVAWHTYCSFHDFASSRKATIFIPLKWK